MRTSALIAAALAAAPAVAQPLLQMPVDCTLGEDCFIQSFVDRDPGAGYHDFTCGPLSYDGHKGTDFALLSHRAMQDGVDVLAAAPGMVQGVRDGMADIAITAETRASVQGRECGNGVAVDHGDGWVTQYCHMRRGSVSVQPGQRVDAGTLLGQVGLSGLTEFPHLHLSVRHRGAVVDPFAADTGDTCGTSGTALWAEPLAYVPGDLIRAGFETAIPAYADVQSGQAGQTEMSPHAPALVFFAYGFGSRAGDVLQVNITGPQGAVLTQTIDLDRTQARWFRATGRRTGASGWPPGPYHGQATLLRGDEVLARIDARVDLR